MSPFRIFHITFYWLWIWTHLHFKCLSLAGPRQAEGNVIAVTQGGGSGVDRKWVHRIQELMGSGAGIHSGLGNCAGAKKQRRKMGRKKHVLRQQQQRDLCYRKCLGDRSTKGLGWKGCRLQSILADGSRCHLIHFILTIHWPRLWAVGTSRARPCLLTMVPCRRYSYSVASGWYEKSSTGQWNLQWAAWSHMFSLASGHHSRPQEDWPRQGQGPPGTNAFQTCELNKEMCLCNRVPTLEVWFALGNNKAECRPRTRARGLGAQGRGPGILWGQDRVQRWGRNAWEKAESCLQLQSLLITHRLWICEFTCSLKLCL